MSRCIYLAVLFVLLGMRAAFSAAAEPVYEPGLVAHYYQDPAEWSGNWPEDVATPLQTASAADWTFREYKYSRVEPVVNHLFINRGWFSVRWKGYFDPSTGAADVPTGVAIAGSININPSAGNDHELVVTLNDGRVISREDLSKGFAGYEGPAKSVFLRPKGQGSQTNLTVNHLPYALEDGKGYAIESNSMTVKIYNDRLNRRGVPMGSWWISLATENGTIICRDKDADQAAPGGDVEGVEVQFEVWADDGCRLIVDDQVLVDDWRPCWEEDLGAIRRSKAIRLKDGKHRIVVEYFEGVSMTEKDADPIKLYWTCPARRISRQIVQPSQLFHTAADLTSPDRN